MDQTLIDKMRADFVRVVDARKSAQLWTDEDERMAASAIKSAIDREDVGLVWCWASWLAWLSARDIADAGVGIEAATVQPHACNECKHLARPGRSTGYCGGRSDLAAAYGETHPLRILPDDGGASCVRFLERV